MWVLRLQQLCCINNSDSGSAESFLRKHHLIHVADVDLNHAEEQVDSDAHGNRKRETDRRKQGVRARVNRVTEIRHD